MKLKDLLRSTTKENVLAALVENYPDQKKNLEGYDEVYDNLLKKKSRKSNYVITITKVENDGDDWYDVYGVLNEVFNTSIKKEEIEAKDTLALEFTGWSTWLGSEVDVEAVHKFGIDAFIAHCLFEMTFCGFDEKSIQKEINILKYRIKESEKKDAVFISHEEAIEKIKSIISKKLGTEA